MALFYVERQPWQHWPKKLVMVRKVDGAEKDERRWYVPEQTCRVVSTIQRESYIEGQTVFEYEHELSCGHIATSGYKAPPDYCPNCGARVIGGTE